MGTHINGENGPPELRGIFIDARVTHAHSCLDHIDMETGDVIFGGVGAARVISPDFGTYDEALNWFCDKTRILNPGDVPPPPTQGEMF